MEILSFYTKYPFASTSESVINAYGKSPFRFLSSTIIDVLDSDALEIWMTHISALASTTINRVDGAEYILI